MLRPKLAVDGRTRGKIPAGLRIPPPALPPVVLARRRVGSTGVPLEEVVREMVVAYKEAVGGRSCEGLLRKMDGDWRHVLCFMAGDLIDEGRSGGGYVRFVCAEVRRTKGRDPWPSEVFSMKSFEGWMSGYRTSGGATLDVDGYIATPERRRAHERRVRACRTS